MGFRLCGDAGAKRRVYTFVIYQNAKIHLSKVKLGIVSSLCGFVLGFFL